MELETRNRAAVQSTQPLTLRSPSSVHLEGGEWEYRPSFLADYGEASCGRMPNDWFAYGTPAVMMQYSRLLLDLPDTYVSMTEDKALRSARLGVRRQRFPGGIARGQAAVLTSVQSQHA